MAQPKSSDSKSISSPVTRREFLEAAAGATIAGGLLPRVWAAETRNGIPYRTLPGTNHPRAAYFVRGSGHNEEAEYTERPSDYVNLMDRLERKFENARRRSCFT